MLEDEVMLRDRWSREDLLAHQRERVWRWSTMP
jgi:hypothetical protein